MTEIGGHVGQASACLLLVFSALAQTKTRQAEACPTQPQRPRRVGRSFVHPKRVLRTANKSLVRHGYDHHPQMNLIPGNLTKNRLSDPSLRTTGPHIHFSMDFVRDIVERLNGVCAQSRFSSQTEKSLVHT
jgi:hypothetical protein